MTSTVEPHSFSSSIPPNPESAVVLRNSFLCAQVAHLHKQIAAKDAALEEIRKYVNQLVNDRSKQIESFNIV